MKTKAVLKLAVDILMTLALLYLYEPAFRTALEYDSGNVPKSGRDKKQSQKPLYYRFHRRIGYRRIWRMGIHRQRFSDLSVFEK